MEESIAELRETFRTGTTKSVSWRKKQLRALLDLVNENEDSIFQALDQDLGKSRVESYRDEIGIIKKSASYSLSCLDKWMAPKKGELPLLFFPAKAEVMPEPLGVVLIFSSWNFPITVALDPLIGAISAGNTVLLKPSELAPACMSFLTQTIPRYLDNKAIKVIGGGADVGKRLLELKWDKIFFTGSPRVGRLVLTAAAKYLTPVTLELGGKCPAIVDNTLSNPSKAKVTAKRIVGGKWGPCTGQACIAIDYVLVEEKLASTLIETVKKYIKIFYGDNLKELKSISRIVNQLQFQRLVNLLKDPHVAASVVYGGSVDEEKLVIEPTILLDPPLDSEIMNEEIFGPLLPIITLKNIEESIEFINSKPNPLVIYAFTENETFKKRILSETSSGSVTFNDSMVQFLCDSLPFGGVGQSGFGRYHGKYSFDTFSHEKSVLHRAFYPELEPRYPPWTNFKLAFLKLAYALDYFGLILLMSGFRKS